MKRVVLIIVTFIILTSLSTWGFVQHERLQREIALTWGGFSQALAQGNIAGVGDYLLTPRQQADPALASLQFLVSSSTPQLGQGIKLGWFSLGSTKTATVPLVLPQGKQTLALKLQRTGEGWRISELPRVLAHPAAMLTAKPGQQALVLIYGQEITLAAGANGASSQPQMGFAVVVGGKLLYFQPGDSKPLSRLLRLSTDLIETEREGAIPLGSSVAFYDTSSGRARSLPKLVTGSRGLSALTWMGKVYGVAKAEVQAPDQIRVVLNTTDYISLEHKEARLSSASGMQIADLPSGQSVRVKAGEIVTIQRSAQGVAASSASGQLLTSRSRLTFTPLDSGRISVHQIIRGTAPSTFNPSYRGTIEVAPAAATGLYMVNELPLNQYLYAVVPSEMPVSFGAEPLKVQALAARAYAVSAILGGGFTAYGAHVDDSVNTQVYNNTPEQAPSTKAVDDTGTLIPVYEGKVVDARFYSTSSGFGASASEVWSDGDKFPGPVIPYLQAFAQTSKVKELPNEKTVQEFLGSSDGDAPDATSPFFRWTITMTRAELEASIRVNLAARQAVQPAFVLTKNNQGQFVSQSITDPDPIGTLQNIRVTRRGAGGNIMTLELVGSKGTYQISKEYNVRFTLRPTQYLPGRPPIALQLLDKSTRPNYSILPSAFATFDLEKDTVGQIQRVVIRGGGNGHGVGMSQYGAMGLAKQGWSYDRIIQYYYPGCRLELGSGLGY